MDGAKDNTFSKRFFTVAYIKKKKKKEKKIDDTRLDGYFLNPFVTRVGYIRHLFDVSE